MANKKNVLSMTPEELAAKYSEADRHVPIQINGVTGFMSVKKVNGINYDMKNNIV
jgi:hypothetical protein